MRIFSIAIIWSLAVPAWAQLGGDAVPDLSGFAGAIAKTASGAPGAAPAAGASFGTKLAVPSVQPGAQAKAIGAQLRAALEQQAGKKPEFAQLETGMPAVLTNVESGLEKEGFQKRDLGVAMAYAFLYNFETSTKQTVPEEASKAAARTVAKAIEIHWGPSFEKMTGEGKEKTYESLLISTTLFSAFAQQFDKAGKTKEADAMRAAAGQLFEKLIGVPASQVQIGADGRITGLAAQQPAAPEAPPGHAALKSPAGIPESYYGKARPTYLPADLLRLGIHWEMQPIPDEFGCFYRGERTPTSDAPDLVLRILDASNYETSIGNARERGIYGWRKAKYGGGEIVWATGPLASKDESWLSFRNFGQEIWIRHLKAGFRCYQKGGAMEQAMLMRSRVLAQPSQYECAASDGRTPSVPLTLRQDGNYTVPGGGGTFAAAIREDNRWEGKIHFRTGPLAQTEAAYTEDRTGLREIEVERTSQRVFAGGLTITANKDTRVICRAVGPARPYAAYGPVAAPAPPAGSGGVEGLYFRFGVWLGMGPPIDNYAFFTKDGYYTDRDASGEEFDIDCKRTRPNGLPRCKTYKIAGGQLLVEGEKPRPFQVTPDGVKIDGSEYSRAISLAGRKLSGHFNAFSFTPTGGFGAMATGGASSSTDLYLKPDGSFSREQFGSFTFSNANQAPTPDVTVGVTAMSQRTNSGQLRFHEYTAEYVFPDGRIDRRLAFTLKNSKSDTVDYFNIDGRNYSLKEEKHK